MIARVLPNLYRIEVPLPGNPLKALNSYVIKGPGRNLVIDTGMNREECSSVMFSDLKELQVELEETDFFITHMHADHSGLVGTLASPASRVFCSRPDADIIVSTDSWNGVLKGACLNGFPEGELQIALKKHPGYKYAHRGYIEFTTVRDGDSIDIGDYHFRCVETPGHTRGHMCLYDREKKIFVSGDHVLDDITPNISMFVSDEGNPLQDYLASLDKVCRLDIELVLPGHRSLIKDLRKRVEQLKQHHVERAEEILSILAKGEAHAYVVASKMSWDIDCPTWEQFPTPQKWFATGEAIAHLRYLEGEGRVKREIKNNINVFSKA
ncbi:MAG: beta-lactamase [Peptococcaceae bacterium BICA1-7]|nr:MAG: beta-lactamase [Peptococcaceae bacterium BICA1-7]HBV99132.1 MBL fold metallo-hydrolase [Desulfotomaculum sp.]